MPIRMYIEQVIDDETMFEKNMTFNSRDELQEAENEAITNWLMMQGKYARIIAEANGDLKLSVSGISDRENWTRIS